jgi:glycosyltransferase involved in cell wall biosynthesis
MDYSNNILVSIIIMSYNSEKYISDAIRSSINQTYGNIEIIISDDASTDNTLNIIKCLVSNNSYPQRKIRVIENKTNLGIVANWFNAVSLAKGEYITSVSADDEILSNKVELQLSVMRKDSNTAITYTDALVVDELTHRTYKFSEVVPTKSGDIYVALTDSLYYSPTIMFKKEYLPKKNLFSKIKHAGDLAFFKEVMILSFPAGRIEYIPEILYKYKVHTNNITKKRAFIYKEHIQSIEILQKHYPKFHNYLNPCIYDFCCSASIRFLFYGNIKLSGYFFLKGIKAAKYNPFKFFRSLKWKSKNLFNIFVNSA